MKKIVGVILSLAIIGTLAGCDSSDYKKAVSLYESGNYLEAMERFEALGDYENSRDLLNQCRYDYAKMLFENGDYVNAREQFLIAEQSEKVSEYLRLTAWGIFINFLGENGPISEKFDQYDVEESTQVESLCEIRKQGKSIVVSIQSTEKISYPILSASQTTVTNTVVSFDGKQMQPELEAKAEVTFKGTKGSSTFQNVGTCLWDIASYKANDPVQWSEFIHIDTDGSMDDTRKAPAFNNRVAMQQTIITSCFEKILDNADTGFTMADLGFVNY